MDSLKHFCIEFILAIVVFNCVVHYGATPASTHLHAHSRGTNQEREEDGGYSPRDSQHISDSGEHHVGFDHEAILGSIKEAEEFDNLSPEESKKRLAVLITKMDLNNDQHIDRNELKAWILRSFRMLSEEDAQERFEDIDENQDRKITWTEYVSDSYGIDVSGEEIPSNENGDEEKLIADDKQMFDAADSNKDGILDEKEFVIFNHPEEHPVMLPIILQQTLRDKDINNDGFVDFQEYIGDRGKNHDKEWLLVEKDKFDQDFDKDKDGRLNGQEILSWVVPSNEEIAGDEVEHLFASSDDDHDNLLSYEEIIAHYDIFVGSEATDYGDQLQNIHHFDDEL